MSIHLFLCMEMDSFTSYTRIVSNSIEGFYRFEPLKNNWVINTTQMLSESLQTVVTMEAGNICELHVWKDMVSVYTVEKRVTRVMTNDRYRYRDMKLWVTVSSNTFMVLNNVSSWVLGQVEWDIHQSQGQWLNSQLIQSACQSVLGEDTEP